MSNNFAAATADRAVVSPETIADYRRDGFVKIAGIITKEEANRFHDTALDMERRRDKNFVDSKIFTQMVNVWRQDPVIRDLVLDPRIASAARALAGVALRLWHDHILIKVPHTSVPTEYHQDQPYWPHENSPNSLSCWIALNDVPVERGCMSFIKGSHRRADLPIQTISDPRSLFTICPALGWDERVTAPLQAGDCTFHHGRSAHAAGANQTDEPRVGISIIFMDDGTTYRDWPHIITDPIVPKFQVGDRLEHPLFPTDEEIATGRVVL